MNWSRPDYTAPPNSEESYNQMCGRNGLDVGWYDNSGSDERNDIVVERNGFFPLSSFQ